jgi:hypothetical protein
MKIYKISDLRLGRERSQSPEMVYFHQDWWTCTILAVVGYGESALLVK